MDLLIASLYLILPAYAANMAPVIAAKLSLPLAKPINKKKFGKNKTWRGFYSGFVAAFIIIGLQTYLASMGYMTQYALLDYTPLWMPIYAFALGIGALVGDSFKSYLKRRHKIKPGAAWFPFDQIDFILGATLFLLPFYCMPLEVFATLLIITPLLHFLTNVIAYFLGLKKVWY